MRAKNWYSERNFAEQRKCSQVKFDQSVRDIILKSPLNFLMSLLLRTDPFCDAYWQMFLSNSIREQRKTNKSYWPRKVFCLQGLKWSPRVFPLHGFNYGKERQWRVLVSLYRTSCYGEEPCCQVTRWQRHVSGSYLNFLIGLPKAKTKTRCDYEKRPAICFLFEKNNNIFIDRFSYRLSIIRCFFCPLSNCLLSSEHQKMR